MDYIVLHADLSGLTGEEADRFADAAAALDLDVQDLPRQMGVPDLGVAVMLSTALNALLTQLGTDGGAALASLVGQLFGGRRRRGALEDSRSGIRFVWDEAAIADGKAATAQMQKILGVPDAFPGGVEFVWRPATRTWTPDQRR